MRYKNYKKFYSNFILYTKPSFIITSLFFYKGFTLPKKFYFSKQTAKNSLKPIFLRRSFFSPKVSHIRFYCKSLVFTKLSLMKSQGTLLNLGLLLKLLSDPVNSSNTYKPEFIIFLNKVFRSFDVLSRNILLKSYFVGQVSSLFIYKLLLQTVVLFSASNNKKKLLAPDNT